MSVILAGGVGPVPGGDAGRVDERPLVRSLRLESTAGSVELTADPYDVTADPVGLTGAPFEIDTATSPSYDGETLRSDRPLVDRLEVFLPILVRGASARAVADATARLRTVAGTRVEDCQLVGSLDDGSTRRINVRRVQAGGDDWHPMSWVHNWRIVPLRLRALDPFWLGDARSLEWSTGGAGGSFLPILPVRLRPSTVLGNSNPVAVGGDVDALPTWTITGPVSSLTIARGDGRTWGLRAGVSLASGETLTVKADPRESSRVWHSVQGVWFGQLTPGSELFSLRSHVAETVTVTATGTTATSSVRVAWSPRFEVLV